MARTKALSFIGFHRWLLIIAIIFALLAVSGWLWLAEGQARTLSALAASEPLYPNGASLVPLGGDQSQLRHAYNGIFDAVYDRHPVAWSAAPSSYGGNAYAAGTVIGLHGLAGNFDSVPTDGSYEVSRAHTLRPVKIALFYSQVRDNAGQVVTWEEATFETIFRVYLMGVVHHDLFEVVDETAIRSGALEAYDVLILPSITIGYADEVAASLGTTGLAAIATWVETGGTLYAQGDGAYLVEAAGLLPAGTVNLNDRLTDEAPYDNLATLEVSDTLNALTFSWLAHETYILDDPLLTATQGITVVATYADTTRPGTPAILWQRVNRGQLIVTNAHPSVRQDTYPLFFDVLFLAMSERVGLTGKLQQMYDPTMPADVIPAYEAGIPISVTVDLRNYWDDPVPQAVLTETVAPGFTVEMSTVVPAPSACLTGSSGTQIVWELADVPHGVNSFEYVVRTLTDTLASGEAMVSSGMAEYVDPFTGLQRTISRKAVWVYAKMAARLNGDRDIELDGIYPLPQNGYYFDIALTLENKEETMATNVVITDVVALLSPIVDVDDQRLIPTVLTDTVTMTATNETIWVENEVFFYNNANYPLPQGVATNLDVINLSNWDGVTYYTYTNELSNTVTIPPGYESMIVLNPDGSIRLPAAVLRWDFGDLQGYDHLDPAVRYGIYSQELLGRQVSFASDPLTDTGVVLNGSGGSVFTNLGGDPIPYHEYLSSGIITIPQSPYKTQVAYDDAWGRPHTLDLRTVFYDIVPFPPPEYHAVVNTTFEMNADWDEDGVFTDPVLEYPSRVPVELHLMLKTHSNFDPMMPPLRKDETLLSQGLFRGLGFTLLPVGGDWANSWSFRDLQGKGPDATVLTDVIETPAYTYLYFQQELDSQAYEVVDITGTLSAGDQHTEGVMKINDGARFVYHQKAVGPSRYEVFDSHVQAVFGLRSDAEVVKYVAPVKVATYEDQTFHIIEVQDPWEPRQFEADPFIQSYGFGDMAATVYVGGRHQRELLWSRLNPGETTQIRVEINNNTGTPLTNLNLVPSAPAGIQVSLRSYTETTAIEPLFFDFPFLNATDIPDAWKGVYYFDVTVDDPFPGDLGQVYTVTFALEGNHIPAYFQIPAAQIGIKDAGGQVSTIYGQGVDLALQDQLPPWVTLTDVRLANETEMQALVDAINYDDAHPGSETALALYETFRTGIATSVVTTTLGSDVSFTLPPYAQTLPWDDNGALAKKLYIILRSDLAIDWSGTALADEAPVAVFTDTFRQIQHSVGNSETVEAHGAVLTMTYTVRDVEADLPLPWQPGDPLPAGMTSTVTIEGNLQNIGDDIAAATLVTTTLPVGVTPISAIPAWTSYENGVLAWYLGDLGPGVTRLIQLVVEVAPSQADFGSPYPLVSGSDGLFLNVYAQRYVTAVIGGGLAMPVGGTLVVYDNDFETSAGREWSNPLLGHTPSGRGFLGEFGNGAVSLNLASLPPHSSISLEFDLFVIRSWDGNQVEYDWQTGVMAPQGHVGPDIWSLQLSGQSLLYTTFSNWDRLDFRQAYPDNYPAGDHPSRTGAVENNSLGYLAAAEPMDAVYHLVFTLPHSDSTLDADFSAAGLQAMGDESWGLDNVRVVIYTTSSLSAPIKVYLPIVAK